MLAENGKQLTAEQQEEESRRLEILLHDSSQQQKLLRDYQGDEDRIARIVSLMPDGFIYQYDGVKGADIRLKYQPNPDFRPPTCEARVVQGMAGTVWIDAREKRLSRLQGTLVSNVDFGYGLLGRLDKGGTFDMERVEDVSGKLEDPCAGRAHHRPRHSAQSIGKDQTERRSDFRQVPTNLSLQQAELLLTEKTSMGEAHSARADAPGSSRSRTSAANLSVAMALK
jgi:hypothetical protein